MSIYVNCVYTPFVMHQNKWENLDKR